MDKMLVSRKEAADMLSISAKTLDVLRKKESLAFTSVAVYTSGQKI